MNLSLAVLITGRGAAIVVAVAALVRGRHRGRAVAVVACLTLSFVLGVTAMPGPLAGYFDVGVITTIAALVICAVGWVKQDRSFKDR